LRTAISRLRAWRTEKNRYRVSLPNGAFLRFDSREAKKGEEKAYAAFPGISLICVKPSSIYPARFAVKINGRLLQTEPLYFSDALDMVREWCAPDLDVPDELRGTPPTVPEPLTAESERQNVHYHPWENPRDGFFRNSEKS